MTRDEFIDGYLKRSKLDGAKRVPNGYISGLYRYYALPCACEDETCAGWAMISDQHISHYLFFDAPEPLRSAWHAAVGGEP